MTLILYVINNCGLSQKIGPRPKLGRPFLATKIAPPPLRTSIVGNVNPLVPKVVLSNISVECVTKLHPNVSQYSFGRHGDNQRWRRRSRSSDRECLPVTQRCYPLGCTEERKRSIRRKATKFVLRDGELYFKKKQKARQLSENEALSVKLVVPAEAIMNGQMQSGTYDCGLFAIVSATAWGTPREVSTGKIA